MTVKPDIQLTKDNIQEVCSSLLTGVTTCSNRKKHTKKSEYFLRCGGGYDTESTTVIDDNGKPKFAFVYHFQICINGQYIYFREIKLVIPFFIALCNAVKQFRQKDKQPVLIIWVANLAHEYAFIKRQLAVIGITDLFAKSDRQPLKITLQKCVELRECLGLFGNSLARIAADYTTTKKLSGDLDYSLYRTPLKTTLTAAEYQYCKNDVVILDELSEVAFEKFTDKQLKIPMTATGILRQKCKNSIRNIKAEYAANKMLMPESEHDYYIMRKYMYAGGLSGTNPLYTGKKINKAKCADVTSDYPAQINHHLFPSGQLRECSPEEIKRHKRQFRIFLFTCDMRTKTAHAVLSRHKILNFKGCSDVPFVTEAESCIVNNGKLQYGKNICLMLNNTDIAALSELYDITNIKLYRCWYFTSKAKAPKFLLKCMNEDYLNKQQLKATGQSKTVLYREYKAAVNSYYGMCSTRLYDCMFGYNEEIEDIDDLASDLSYSERRCRMWLSPYIGYWCTSYARALLMYFIARYPELIIQYDTDSLYYITDTDVISADRLAAFEAELIQYNRKIELKNRELFNNDVHFLDLGAWEFDEEYTGFKGIGAKRYLKETSDGEIIPVVAGMVKESFAEYLDKNNLDAYTEFDSDLTLNRVTSKKIASLYYDGACKKIMINGKLKKVPDFTAPDRLEKVTDYQGHTEIVQIITYHALFSVEFKIKDISDYLTLCQAIQEEKALPVKYRVLEPYINEWSVKNYG